MITPQSLSLVVNTDGGARGNPGPAAAGIVIHDEEQHLIEQFGRFLNTATNNEAEYSALLLATDWIVRFCDTTAVEKATFLLDSQLVVQQVLGRWKIKEARLLSFCQKIRAQLATLPCPYEIKYVPRAENSLADGMVNQILDQQQTTTAF